jgi:hypothetical protein
MKYEIFFKLSLVLWGLAIVGVMSVLGSQHYLALLPTKTTQITPTTSENGNPAIANQLKVTHILAPGCRCSEFVTRFLLSEKLPLDPRLQTVIWVGEKGAPEAEFKGRGFEFKKISESDLNQNEVEGVPTLLISRNADVIYAGGYAPTRIQRITDIQFQSIYNNLTQGSPATSWPIFGCATSHKYRRLLDPWGIKYSANNKEIEK